MEVENHVFVEDSSLPSDHFPLRDVFVRVQRHRSMDHLGLLSLVSKISSSSCRRELFSRADPNGCFRANCAVKKGQFLEVFPARISPLCRCKKACAWCPNTHPLLAVGGVRSERKTFQDRRTRTLRPDEPDRLGAVGRTKRT